MSVWCADWHAAEQMAVVHLGPRLTAAQHANIITSWWFVRKGPSWRVRLLPSLGQDEQATTAMEQTMHDLSERGAIQRWAVTIYEPEIHAFGGADGIQLAHDLFHADSHHLLSHLGHRRSDHRRELGLLLGTLLVRAAGQERYEQGDVWAQVLAHRPTHRPPVSEDTVKGVHRLLTARTYSAHSPLAAAPDWPTAFRNVGERLAELALHGRLTRGLRAVLAHHILFAWNRAGIPADQQALLAAAAAQVIFLTDPPTAPCLICGRAAPAPTTLSAVTTKITDVIAPDPVQLRAALADRIRNRGTFQSLQVEAAFRTVSRHLFLPGVDLWTAYAHQVVVTKRADDGSALSSASHPNLVAAMLEQLDVRPGQRVLEIGTATGINAALLAELVGPTGTVRTIEIDDELAAGARVALAAAGYRHVEVICADGALGHPVHAPYERIIVTADAWDLPATWWQQLAVGGRLVVPLSLHGSGLARSVALDLQHGNRMVGNSALVCGFVPMRGSIVAQVRRSLHLADDVILNLDASDPMDETALRQVLTYPAHEHWTGVVINHDEPVEHLDLWLVTLGCRFARLSVQPGARESGVVNPARRWAGAALHDGENLVYLALRPRSSDTDELGTIAHGPDSATLAAHTAELLHQWNRERPTQPTITAQPAHTPDDQRPHGYHIDRPETRLTIAW
ncbi:MAG: methyltransferase, FxLD system [Pseudonocardiaceae bacterium]